MGAYYIISVMADSQEDAIKKLGWAAKGLKDGTIPFDGFVMVKPMTEVEYAVSEDPRTAELIKRLRDTVHENGVFD